jgi:DNA-binding GntR family transcriptional regulator
METTFSPVQETTIKPAETIYRTLKNEILRGVVEPGALLSESKLAKRFGVSRTPVREALSMLNNDRLISSLPQRGHQVRTIPFSEAMDAFRLRELLEVEAIRLAVNRISDEKITYLKQLIENAKDNDLYVANYEFHTTIAKASGNRILAEYIEELLALMERILVVHPDFLKYSNEAIRPEAEIVEALEKRDENAACEAMRRHIRDTMSKVLQV